MNLKNIASHLLGILRKKGVGTLKSQSFAILFTITTIIFLKAIKNQIYSKNVPVFVWKKTKQNINRLPLSTKTICFS